MRRSMGMMVLGSVLVAAVGPAAASAATKTVYAGGPLAFQGTIQKRYGAGVDAFFGTKVTIHAGDTVRWVGLAQGFHTVDLPGASTTDLPLITAAPGHLLAGVKDASGNPFWFNGQATLGLNAALFAPSGGAVYDGSRRIDSALPVGKPRQFQVKFTKAGTYRYFCDIHYGMEGVVKVVPARAPVPSAPADARAVAKQAALAVASAQRLDKTQAPAGTVQLGAAAANGVEVFAMFPNTAHVTVGTTLSFSMSAHTREVHSASFGDTSKNGYLAKLANSITSPAIDPAAVYPSDPPPAPSPLSPLSHGNGFASTGLLDADRTTPLPPSGRITFTQAGTYHFICLIHPFMHGTVVVG